MVWRDWLWGHKLWPTTCHVDVDHVCFGPHNRGGWFSCILFSSRCLDEAEKALRPSAPQIPECPICGKPFLTLKSRISHLKQCAVKMEVGPQLLLQAVRLQTAQPEGTCSTLAPAPAPALASR